jgi:hypothetical protein
VLAPVIEYLADAQRSGRLHVPDAEQAAAQLSTLAFGMVRFFISKPLAGSEERRLGRGHGGTGDARLGAPQPLLQAVGSKQAASEFVRAHAESSCRRR